MQFLRNVMTNDKTRIIQRNHKHALLVLVGLGSQSANWDAIVSCFDNIPMDIFIPDYIAHESLEGCVDNLAKFIIEQALTDYKALHVFAYILGGKVFNRYLIHNTLPNLQSIIYDRSPWQERAPKIITDTVPWLARLTIGNVIFDLAQSDYVPYHSESVKVGLCIESERTPLMTLFKRQARRIGEIQWHLSASEQPHHDYCYIPLNHNQMYTHLGDFTTVLQHFYVHECFPVDVNRTPPKDD